MIGFIISFALGAVFGIFIVAVLGANGKDEE